MRQKLSTKGSTDDLTNTVPNRFKIADRLDKAVSQGMPNAKNRSPDLVPLTKEYELLRKNLRALLATTKAYQVAVQTIEEARSEVRFIQSTATTTTTTENRFRWPCTLHHANLSLSYCAPGFVCLLCVYECLWVENHERWWIN
jgi:hypothetical protein